MSKKEELSILDSDLFMTIPIKGDGNCFYYSISYLICGDQYRYADSLRYFVCQQYIDNYSNYKAFELTDDNISPNSQQNIHVSNICLVNNYADAVSIRILAEMYNIKINIYTASYKPYKKIYKQIQSFQYYNSIYSDLNKVIAEVYLLYDVYAQHYSVLLPTWEVNIENNYPLAYISAGLRTYKTPIKQVKKNQTPKKKGKLTSKEKTPVKKRTCSYEPNRYKPYTLKKT